jgi:DNA-directed RNA polymerase specialized sigma24 family protein
MARSMPALDFLTQRQQQCLALYFYDGLNTQQIADELGIARPVVSRHLKRGKARLAARGMVPKRRERADLPQLYTMDPSQMDRLGPGDVKAVW